MAATTKTLVSQFVKLTRAKKKHEGDLEKIAAELAKLDPEIRKRFEEASIQSMKLKGGPNVYIRRELWAGMLKDVPNAEVLMLEGLKSAGLGDMVKEKVNTQTLSAWVREQEKEHFGETVVSPEELLAVLPEALHTSLKITETFKLRALGV